MPWCVKKCPYCDFNSYALNNKLPEEEYLAALLRDLQNDLHYTQNKSLTSIFFGGGTPSLISPKGYESLLRNINNLIPFAENIEITLEVNPGTIEHFNLADYKTSGINRISLGVQSFNDAHLQALGRIHTSSDTMRVIEQLHAANFRSFNLDLMHGLPKQTLEQAVTDIQTAVACDPPHVSWYQLTLEPNTLFYKYPPKLPNDELAWEIQEHGEQILANAGFTHYEISAFAKPQHACKHNINYWEFGDYLGIGAGAHGKLTNAVPGVITRTWKTRSPKDYLDPGKNFLAGNKPIATYDIAGEFMLNRLRLFAPLELQQFTQRTGLPTASIIDILNKAQSDGLMIFSANTICLTEHGKRFLNNVMQLFLAKEDVIYD